ncbi:MAG: DMT family transporter [Bacteroidia bacterium]|nr:DMT family transporter [Bacteroidia bacterium]
MIKSPQTKGYLFAMIAAFTATNTYFSSKHILSFVTVFQFGILWYGFGLFYNSVYLTVTGKVRETFTFSFNAFLMLLVFAVLEVISTTCFFSAIKLVDNPAIVSFLVNLSPALVTLLGMLLLKERFSLKEGLGIILAITGAFLISFKWSLKLNSLFVDGSELVLISVLCLSLNVIIAKRYISQLKPELLAITRVIGLLLFSLVALSFSNDSFSFPKEAVLFAMYGALVGPFLGAYAQYFALKYIPASKAMIIQSSKSFLILFMAFMLLGLWPLWIQVVGGVLTVTGIILVTIKFEKRN